MNKSILVVFLVLLTSLFVWAGGDQESGSTEVPADIQWVTADRIGNPNASITLTYAVDLTYSHQTQTASRKEFLTSRMEEWAKAHPDVKLIPQILSNNPAERLAKQLEQAATGSMADAAQIDGQFVPLFYRWLQPIDSYFSAQELDDWFDWCKKEAMIDPQDGKLKGAWMLTNTVGLWYDKTAVPNPPQSWDEVIKVGKELQNNGYQYGFLTWGGKNEQISYGSVFPMFFGLGGDLVDSSGKPVYGEGDNRAKLIEVFKFWDRAVKEGVVPQRVLDINNNGDLAAAAKEKTAAMFLGGSWLLSVLKDNLGSEIESWDFTNTPQKSASIKMQIPGGYCMAFFAKDKKKLDLIVDFMKYVYVGADGMAGWCSAAGYTPVRKSVFENYAVFKEDRFQQAFGKVISTARTRPNSSTYSIISEHVQEGWQNVILGRQTPEEAVDTAFKKTLNQIR
ncbi:extracellular solute-binding protein [Marispirochaeta sp.]|uniref:extracellular solute-binding protein n=1 Tax=Marispirochaeta sp. TaxID=2038653 RepID=UPI0029C6B00F|nr:extracellular solute-binding protein [Marispirochaeta sp.]